MVSPRRRHNTLDTPSLPEWFSRPEDYTPQDDTDRFIDKSILSFDANGKVRELLLQYRLAFRVRDGRGRDYVPQSEISATRDISYDDAQVLSKESEEQLLYRDMQSDMVQQILRRLAAAPAQPISFESKAGDAAAR